MNLWKQVGIEALGIPHGDGGANQHSLPGALEIQVGEILEVARLLEDHADRDGGIQLLAVELGNPIHFTLGQHARSPPILLAPQPEQFSRQLGVVFPS